MTIQYPEHTPAPKDFFASYPSGGNRVLLKQEDHFRLSDQLVRGHSRSYQINSELLLTESELSFSQDTVFRERHPERRLFQISFCLGGTMEWTYRGNSIEHSHLSPTQSSIQSGFFSQCESCYREGETYRAISISFTPERYPELCECFHKAGVLNTNSEVCTRIFSSTPHVRLLLNQIQETPFEHSLRRLYLEGKILELLASYCDEVILQDTTSCSISREDYHCLLQARELIDRQFAHPLTISQIAGACFLSETKLKQGFKTCFGCTVYEYIVEKRMEMAFNLLQTGKYKVKDVVWMVGYSNASHFTESFRKRYGVNPGDI